MVHRATQVQKTIHTHSWAQTHQFTWRAGFWAVGGNRRTLREPTRTVHRENIQPGTVMPWDDGANQHIATRRTLRVHNVKLPMCTNTSKSWPPLTQSVTFRLWLSVVTGFVHHTPLCVRKHGWVAAFALCLSHYLFRLRQPDIFNTGIFRDQFSSRFSVQRRTPTRTCLAKVKSRLSRCRSPPLSPSSVIFSCSLNLSYFVSCLWL